MAKTKNVKRKTRADRFAPDPKMKFTFGLWTVGNPGRDPFGGPTRQVLPPWRIADLLGSVGAYGVNFHDNDLVPIDATDAEAEKIKKDFRKALRDNDLKVPMATTNLFADPVFKDGAFTSSDSKVRAYAVQKTMRAMDLGAEFGAKIYVFWGGREGVDTDAAKDPVEAIKRMRRCINFLCAYAINQGYDYRFAFEAKPNEPRGHLYHAVTGSYLAFIQTLDHPEMCGVNPEVAHEHIAGLNFVHQVAAALDAGKLFHIDLNDQEFGRYDQDLRFGSVNLKHCFFLVKLLEDHKYKGPRHFDSHAFRTADYKDVKRFAAGSMRTYMILKDKADRWNKDKKVQSILKEVNRSSAKYDKLTREFTTANMAALLQTGFDREKLAAQRLAYEELDQLTMDIIMGVR